MFEIKAKGRTVKVSGLPIIRVPKGEICLIRNFHIINYDNAETYEVVKQGEISYVSEAEYDYNLCEYPICDIRFCKFEHK